MFSWLEGRTLSALALLSQNEPAGISFYNGCTTTSLHMSALCSDEKVFQINTNPLSLLGKKKTQRKLAQQPSGIYGEANSFMEELKQERCVVTLVSWFPRLRNVDVWKQCRGFLVLNRRRASSKLGFDSETFLTMSHTKRYIWHCNLCHKYLYMYVFM